MVKVKFYEIDMMRPTNISLEGDVRMGRAADTTFGAENFENMARRVHRVGTQQMQVVKGHMPIHLTFHKLIRQAPTYLLQGTFEFARKLRIVLDRMSKDEYIVAEEHKRNVYVLCMKTKFEMLALIPYRVYALMQSR